MTTQELKFDEKGLIPAVVQDFYTRQVLTVAYMNAESLESSIREGRTCFFSRSSLRRCACTLARSSPSPNGLQI